MKIAIVGAGAMGQLFGAHLIATGQTVTMIDSSEMVCEGINRDGIKVRTGSQEFHVNATAATAQDSDDVVDVIMVFTKGPHTRSAVASIQHLITDETVGVSLQNGLGNEELLVEVFGADRTIIGMTDFPSQRAEDGVIYSEPTGHVVVGGLRGGAHIKAQLIARILDESGMNASFDPNVMIPIWEKVIFNAVYNMVSGATGLTVGGVYDVPEARDLATAILNESLKVVEHEGIAIDEERIRENIVHAHQNHADHKTSMLVDIESGRPTEVETIGGAIERAGKRIGTPTPTLSAVCNLIRIQERNR
ncbi:2-dehydropantoate 2-reductase [Yaniella flava]|uniref:2-dehydropantoate 2-reductase n=1 Tax=Yaniella flava TaxID=287930 RepID=A0ABN2UZY8_9MICC